MPLDFVPETLFVAAVLAVHVIAVFGVELAGAAGGGEAPGEIVAGAESEAREEVVVGVEGLRGGGALDVGIVEGLWALGAFDA